MLARLGRRTAAAGKRNHANDADPVVQRERDHIARADLLAGLGHPASIDPDVPGFDDRLGDGPALGQANEEQEAVDAQVSADA